MVSASCVATVNAVDIPEVTLGAQRASRKKKKVVPKWSLAFVYEHGIIGSKPDFETMFPSFEPALLQAIVAESPSWEKAFEVLFALTDNNIVVDVCSSAIAKDPVTDHVGFPTLLDADGWEVVCGVDVEEEHDISWCDVVRAAAQGTPSIDETRLWNNDAEVRQHRPIYASEGHLKAEVEETEHECRQRRGIERRLKRAKHHRQPTKLSGPSKGLVTKLAGKDTQKSENVEPPAWRLCRFEDRL